MTKQIAGFAAGIGVGALAATLFFTGMPGVARVDASAQAKGAATSKIVLENARVRVKDVTFPPGVSAGMHTHDLAHVGVIIQGGTLIFKSPDGKTETAKLETGGVGYRDANVTHDPMNPGKTAVRVIEVELK
jgi:mannose-6-phosphate isomerase-like protein (cupin superfamily)